MASNERLIESLYAGNAAEVDAELERGADPNHVSVTGETPLGVAALAGDEAIVERLLAAEADPSVDAGDRGTPLELAVFAGHSGVAALLHAADPSVVNTPSCEDGLTPLMRACHTNDECAAGLLLSLSADLCAVDPMGRTPLSIACKREAVAVAELLISSSAEVDPYPAEADVKNPLFQAARAGSAAVVALLLRRGAKAWLTHRGATPRDVAVRKGRLAVVAVLGAGM